MSVVLTISEREFEQANQLLKTLDLELRQIAVKSGLAKAADIVVAEAKRQVPQPGYPHDRPGKKPLRDTLTKKVDDYPGGTFVATVGAAYPAGAHAHLVHDGHEVWMPRPPGKKGAEAVNLGKKSRENRFLERAADNTSAQQVQAIISTLMDVDAGRIASLPMSTAASGERVAF